MSSDSDYESNRRGSEKMNSEPRFLVIGEITKPHGVKGEVRVLPHTDLPERFNWITELYVGEDDPQLKELESVRGHKGLIILKLGGCDSRQEADMLRGQLLLIREDQAIPLAANEYFLYQLIDLSVETLNGEQLGTLVEVLETGANNVFVVKGARGELLIPDIPEVVKEIDFSEGRMVIDPLPGLLNA
jgi:16S rRNA processing protein RimM